MTTRVDPTAEVAASARVGEGSTIWGLAQVREGALVGRDCVIGRGAYIGAGVRVGDRCKVQNQALVYEPAVLDDGVFVGPGCILTNDEFPRAVTPEGSLKAANDWRPVGVTVREGASLGAGAICIAPVEIGRWAMVAAGAVVTRDVPDYALVVGTPAQRRGWVGPAGMPLEETSPKRFRCPQTGAEFVEVDDRLDEVARP